MGKVSRLIMCFIVIMILTVTSVLAEENANSVPAGFVDEGNAALQEILEYFPEETIPNRSTFARSKAGANVKKIEVVFVIDATGSMSDAIANVKRNIASFAQCFSGEQYNLRLGLIEYKDTTVDGMNSTIIHTVGHTPWLNTTSFISELQKVSVNGGGDGPETPIDAMGYLTGSGFAWSSDAYKYAVLVTDAGYKVTNRHGITSLNQLGQMLSDRDVHTSVITSSSYADDYGEFAAMTGGIADNIYADFGNTLTSYAYAIMGAVESTASYSVRVLDSITDLPIAGATISKAGSDSYTTNKNGIVTMKLKSSELSDLRLSADGYETRSDIGIHLAQDTIVDLTMTLCEDDDGNIMISADDFVNPASGDGNISGPNMNVLGHSFPVLKVPLKMDLWFFNKARMSNPIIDLENKTIEVAFGPFYKLGSDVPENATQTINMVKNVKNAFSRGGFPEVWKNLDSSSKVKNEGRHLGFLGEGYLLTYGKLSWASGSLELIESDTTVALRTKNLIPEKLKSWRLPAPFSFAFAKFGVLFEAVGKPQLEKNSAGKFGLTKGSIRLAGRPDFSLNAGASKAYVGAGIYGNIGADAKLPWENISALKDEKKFSVNLKADGYLEARFFGFRNRWSLPLKVDGKDTLQLFPSLKGLDSTQMKFVGKSSSSDVFNLSDFTIIPRSARPFVLRSLILSGPALPDSIYKEEYAYSDSRPTLLKLEDGRTMLLWLKDDVSRSSINKSSLVYAIYDGTEWSDPAAIDHDGTADYIYTAVFDNGKVYVLWQDAARVFGDDETLEEIIPDVGLSYAVFDGNSFSTALQSSGTGRAMFMPNLVVNGDDVTAIWAENSLNDPLLSSGDNSIHYANVTSAGWGVSEMLVSAIGQLDDMKAFGKNSNVYVAYVEGDENKAQLLVSSNLNTPKQLYESEIVASLQYVDERLFWSNGDSLLSSTDLSAVTTEIEDMRSGNFCVIENDTNAAIIFEESNGYAINAGVYYQQGDGWSKPALLTNTDGRHELLSGTLNNDGAIIMAYQYSIMDTDGDEPIQSTHMLVSRYEPTSKLVADETLYYDLLAVEPDTDLELVMKIRNEGTAPSAAFNVVLTDENDQVLATKNVTSAMAIGEERDITFTYRLPSVIQGKTLTAELRNSSNEVLPGENVRAIAEIGHGDLVLVSLDVSRTESGADAVAVIRNDGGRRMRENKVTVKIGGDIGSIISTNNLKDLASGEETSLKVSIPASVLTANDQYDFKIIRFEVESESEEVVLYNNVMEKLLDPIPVESVKLDKQNLEMAVGQSTSIGVTCLPETAANKNVVWHCDNLEVVDVDPETGKIIALKEGSATVTAVSEHGNLSDSCLVIVGSGSLSVRGVSITGATEIALNDQVVLTAVIEPDTALNKTVQWYCDNDNCVLTPGPDGTVIVKGMQEGQSKITVVTADGGYTCEVTVTVINMEPFEIVEQPKSVSVALGDPAEFVITVSGGKEPYTYQWEVLNEGKWQAIEGENTNVLRIASVTMDDDGKTFRCRVADSTRKDLISDEVILSVVPDMVLPNTGDRSNLALWSMIALTCAAGVLMLNKKMHA